jgi:uncharacterized protein (TIGR02391 family)
VVQATRYRPKASHDDLVTEAQVVEQILDRVLPRWRETVPANDNKWLWQQHREAAQRALVILDKDQEIRANLGEDAPSLSAAGFHRWVWDGARPMWQSNHYGHAVVSALLKVQAETQNKTGRHDLSETNLFKQVFTTDAPKAGAARLRVRPDDGSDTYKSVQRGAMSLAEGLFAGIRNVVAHTVAESQTDQQIALEQLGAVSVLARWVDDATVEALP